MAEPAQGQIVPDHLIANRTGYERLLTEHFACVSPKAVNQMLRALDRPSNRLWTEILAPSLLLDAGGHHHHHHNHHNQMDVVAACTLPLHMRPIYLPIAETVRTKGRNHKLAMWAREAAQDVVQGQISLFANPLRIGSQNENGEWEPPSHRVVGAPYTKEAERERVAAERAKDRQAVAPLRRRLEARAARQEPKRHRGRLTGVDQN